MYYATYHTKIMSIYLSTYQITLQSNSSDKTYDNYYYTILK